MLSKVLNKCNAYFLVVLIASVLAACGRPDGRRQAAEGVSGEMTQQTDAKKPQAGLSKITIPDDLPQDLPIPHDIQLEKHLYNQKENTSVLQGLVVGKMRQLITPLNNMMQAKGWQTNLLLPQQANTLMHYTKGAQSVVIELREAPNEVTVYTVTYSPVMAAQR